MARFCSAGQPTAAQILVRQVLRESKARPQFIGLLKRREDDGKIGETEWKGEEVRESLYTAAGHVLTGAGRLPGHD